MKTIRLLLFFLLITPNVFAQKIYQSSEVETPAEPNGGLVLLNKFIEANLQVPISTRLEGKESMVLVSGVVETDGSITEVKVAQSGSKLTDSEAIRVVQLYKAWKPAIFKGEKVRQVVDVPVVFNVEPLKSYDPAEKVVNEYYDKFGNLVEKEAKQRFKISVPLDDFGYITGRVIYSEKSKNGWNIMRMADLETEDIWHKTGESGKLDSIKAVRTVIEDKNTVRTFSEMVRQEDGRLLDYKEYTTRGKLLIHKSYYLNEVLKSVSLLSDDSRSDANWYPNGQLMSVIDFPRRFKDPGIIMITEFWDENGNQLIKNGNGGGRITLESYNDGGVIEEGMVQDGLKIGHWTGKLADGTLLYEEHFEKGVLTNGTSFSNGQKLTYSNAYINPEFNGGIPGMYKFISRNMKYPKDAAKKNVSGKVVVSFVVCEDGSLCDYKIVKPLMESMDKEALRVVKEMSGKWQPGWMRGKKVRVKYNLPIYFQLQ